jgi:enolase
MSDSTIQRVFAREVLDSRGKPTVEAEVHLAGGAIGSAIVPSGASTGAAEACELRDGDPSRYDGQGVLSAVRNVNERLSKVVFGLAADDQETIDRSLLQADSSQQKTTLGANAILAVSLATAQAAAVAKNIPLWQHLNEQYNAIQHRFNQENALYAAGEEFIPLRPRMTLPMTNMISGGKHAGGNLDFQDILIQPVGAPDYRTGLEWIVRVYRRLGELLNKAGYEGYLVGDEGGYGPRLPGNRACDRRGKAAAGRRHNHRNRRRFHAFLPSRLVSIGR